jgi:endonuclease/exonuclease/phosphatase family metal-dependent hydrolase
MTYNVHRCVGSDGVLAPERVAEVIRGYRPDVVALQELDVGRARSQHANQPALLAEMLGMQSLFFPAMEKQDEHYGDALLSPHELEKVHLASLPSPRGRERRGALWATLRWQGVTIHVFNTHLGLGPGERLTQIDHLLGEDWLCDPRCGGPRLVCGDFNAWPGTRAYARLRAALHDPLAKIKMKRATFPARWPLVQLDHIFVSDEFIVHHVEIPRTPLTRVASDHLPLVVAVSLAAHDEP